MIFLKRRALMTRASFNYKTVSGIGSITLKNCVETKFKRLSLLGNSAQGETPSIESPKEIKNSGKYDETSGKYLFDVNVTGKNLFDVDAVRNENGNLNSDSQTALDTNRFDIVEGRQYLLISKGSTLTDGTGYSTPYFGEDDLRYGLNHLNILGINPGYQMFTKNERRKIILKAKKSTTITKFIVHGYNRVNDAYEVEEMGLFETANNNANIEYEPYHEQQTVQLQLDEPLRGIGEYKDVITKDGILRKILQVRIADYLQKDIYGKPGGRYIFSEVPNCYINYNRKQCMSNVGFTTNQEDITYMPVPYLDKFKLGVADDDTVETIREKVKDVVVAYTVKEPILEALPTELELALSNLYTNDGTTIINVDSGEVETGIEVEYAVKE